MKNRPLRCLWHFTKGHRLTYLAGVVNTFLFVLVNYMTPLVTAFTIGNILNKKPFEGPAFLVNLIDRLGGMGYLAQNLWICAIAVVMLVTARSVVSYFQRRFIGQATEGIVKDIKDKYYDHVQRLPYDYHVKAKTGDLIQRAITDVEGVRRFLSDQSTELARGVFIIVVASTILAVLNWQLAILSLMLMPFAIAASYFFAAKIQREFLVADEADGVTTTVLQENLTGVRVVRAFGRERFELEKYTEKLHIQRAASLKFYKTIALLWGSMDVFAIAQQAVTICGGLYFVIAKGMPLADFLIFNSYIGMLVWPVRQLGKILADSSKAIISLRRINEILLIPEETEHERGPTPPLRGDLVFDNVSFSYNGDNMTLKNVSFTAKEGQTVAILGATGSGKSSLVHLLQRLYEPNRGKITIGGNDILKIDKEYLRSRVGIVLQEPFLFSRSIAENIAMSQKGIDMAKIREEAKIAAVDDVIETFEDKYDTVVGERGVTLSGGQKQRVAIARTLMKDNDILIFDDSLSAVDLETDAKIRAHMLENQTGAITFIISHRISTLSQADLILVMEDGRITASGKHEELIQIDGLYKKVWEIQNYNEAELTDTVDGKEVIS